MRFRLRTLLIVLALGPLILAGAYLRIERQIRHKAARARLNAAWDIGMQEAWHVFKELSESGQLD